MKRILSVLLAFALSLTLCAAAAETVTDECPAILAAGGSFAFLRTQDGVIWGWGDNTSGQLGIENNKRQQLSVHSILAVDGAHVKDIQCGNISTLVLMDDGTLWACGGNNYGQGGTGADNKKSYLFSAVQITGVTDRDIVQIACGFGQCMALTSGGEVWIWGRNSNSQQGTGIRGNSYEPRKLDLQNIVQVECGGKFCMALDSEGQVWGWGDNSHGELLELSNGKNVATPTVIESLTGRFVKIACAGSSAYGIDADGKVWSWGRNDYKQLGRTTSGGKDSKTPGLVELPEDIEIAEIWAYNSHTAILTTDGKVWLWGRGSTGQTGNGSRITSVLPMQIGPEGETIVDVAVGSSSTYLLTDKGELYSAGYAEFGQMGAFKKTHYYVTSWVKNPVNASGEYTEPD